MTRKKRKQRTTVYVVKEGERREQGFYEFLYELYSPNTHNLSITTPGHKGFGGSSDSLVLAGLRVKDNYDRVYVWFDEDVPLSSEIRNLLGEAWQCGPISADICDKDLQQQCNIQRRNPILIVSNPCSCDGFLFELCCKKTLPGKKTKEYKMAFAGLTHAKNKDEEVEYYRTHFTKTGLEKENNPILQELLTIFKK